MEITTATITIEQIGSHDQITESDAIWLAELGIIWNPKINEEINNMINADVEDMRLDYDPELRQATIDNRRNFFDLLSLPTDKIAERHDTLFPIHQVIASMKMLTQYELDIQKITTVLPNALAYDAQSIESKIEVIKAFNLDYKKIINYSPPVLSLSSELLQDNIRRLGGLGLDVEKVIYGYPHILNYKPETIVQKLKVLDDASIESIEAVNGHPGILGLSVEILEKKINFLKSYELPTDKILSTRPSILGLSLDNIEEKINNVKLLGFNMTKIIEAFPAILTYNSESLKNKIDALDTLGLDAVSVIEILPAILGMSTEKINLTVYTLMKMGRWDGNNGYREQMNQGKNISIFAIPIESLLLYIHSDRYDPQKNIGSAAKTYVKSINIKTAGARKEAMERALNEEDICNELGYLATLYALKEKVDIFSGD